MTCRPAALVAVLALADCSGGGGGPADAGDAGGFSDICNDSTSAKSTPQCQLQITSGDAGACQQYYIDHVDKQLWLWVQLPATLPNGLFTLNAGYTAPSTAVDLAFNMLASDLTTSLAVEAATQSPTGKPGLIQYTFPLDPTQTPPGSLLWLDFHDQSDSHDDVHNPFCVSLSTITDPDPNSATTPTVVTLGAASGGFQTGTCANTPSGNCEGVLSTPGRTDTFTISVPAGGSGSILDTDITAMTTSLAPPPAYDLAFTILDGQTPLNTGSVPNQYTNPNLASALLVKPGETYTIQVYGLNPADTPPAQPGPPDVRVTYNLTVELLPVLDTNASTIGSAFATPIQLSAPGTSEPQTGRLSYLGQEDWFYLSFPATSGPSRLHYKFTAGTSGNRFPAMGPTPPDRLAFLMIDIPPLPDGGSSSAVCLEDQSVCPQDPEYVDYFIPDSGNMESYQSQILTQLCTSGDGDGGSLCLLSGREEFNADEAGFTPLQNFEGIVPLQGTGAQGMVLEYLSAGSQYADDMPYTLALDWETMPNPVSSLQDPLSFGTLGSSDTTQSGSISVGYGFLVKYLQMLELPDVRGSSDYDATPSTADVWEADVPASLQNAPEGATWGLGWSVTDPNGGMPAEGVILSVTFCTSANVCSSFGQPQGSVPGAIAFDPGADLPWWDPTGQGGFGVPYMDYSMYPLFTQTMLSDGYSVTASPFSCTCIQPNYLPAGKFYVSVLGVDRTAWTDTDYTLSMSLTSYPQSTGAGITCPVGLPVPDGGTDAGPDVGCQFIHGFHNN